MEERLLGPKISCFSKHKVTILISFLIIILVVVSIILIVVLSRKSDEESIPFKVIKNDADFIKPNISLNANFKLIKTKNGMTGLLINDPYAKYSLIDLHIPNGSFTETTPGLAHFGEHMVSGGSQNYPNIYPVYNPIIGGVLNKQDNAHKQVYYMGVPYNFLLEETIDMFMDSFKYPLYKEDVVKKEIQVVNAEFYLRVNSIGSLLDNFLRELSSSKTSFHGMTCGNNETLRLNESEILSKKLKGYHMEVKRPDNIFFSLYSNTDMSILEEYAKKYFTYTMHQYKDNEIDVEDKKN
jgi:secreted Zn-dependent insulinase-like peptidase